MQKQQKEQKTLEKSTKNIYNEVARKIHFDKLKGAIFMNIKITGKDLKATEAIKNYIDSKTDRIQKYFENEELDLYVTIKKKEKIKLLKCKYQQLEKLLEQ